MEEKSMYELTERFPHDIFYEEAAPFLSLYQPTERAGREKQQNEVVFRHMLKDLEQTIKEKYPDKDPHALLKPFHELAGDRDFWRKVPEGIAVFAAGDQCVVYRLARPVKQAATASDRPFISPLIRVFQSADDYQLLGLDKNSFCLFEGNRYGLKKVELPDDTLKTKEEVVGEQKTESHLAQRSVGGGSTAYFGQGGRKDEVDKDTEKFFRYVDRFVAENHSKKTQLPLILAAVKEHHGHFHKLSGNPHLMDNGVKSAYSALEPEELTKRAWEIIEPVYLEKTKKVVDTFETARAREKGSQHLEEIAAALIENRLAHLIIEDGKVVPGEVDENTGEVNGGRAEDRQAGDILGDLTEMAFKRNVPLVVLPEERMPVDTGAAGVFRG
jgi:hypothetical protein